MVQVSITNCIFFYKRMYKKVFFNYNQKITQNFIKMNNKVCHTYIQYRYGKIRSQNSHSKQQSQSYIYWQFLELLSFWPCVECQCCMPSKIVESKSYMKSCMYWHIIGTWGLEILDFWPPGNKSIVVVDCILTMTHLKKQQIRYDRN